MAKKTMFFFWGEWRGTSLGEEGSGGAEEGRLRQPDLGLTVNENKVATGEK